MADETQDTKDRNEQILAEAKERFKLCQDKDSDSRARSLDDLEFLDGQDGKQWGEAAYRERQRDNRPALTVNRMDQFVQQITNTMRQNRIAARVFPVDDKGDSDTADILQGLLRHIEYNSDADLAYGTAAFYAVAMGWGYWILRTQYVSPYSFETELVIDRVYNPFQVYLDPNHRHPAGRDAKYGFKFTKFSKDEYKKAYPNSELTGADWDVYKSKGDDWNDGENVIVAEYYKIESKHDTLVRLKDGSARLKSELPEGYEPMLDPKTGKPVERATSIETVKWFKLNGTEILEETVFPTQPEYVALPIVKVVGNELDIDGKLALKGIIRNLKDAQRQYNFMLSAQTEAIDSSKGQIIVREGQTEGHEQEWAEAHKRKVLTIKDTTIEGKPTSDPTRLQPNMSIPAMTEARLMAADDLKALTGIYDAALGAKSNETSGRAIANRQAQSDTANYHFTGNLVRSVNHSTRLVIGAIPTVYDTPRTVRIVGEDDEQKVVKINELFVEGEQPRVYHLGGQIKQLDGTFADGKVGKYDAVCEAGPSPATQKEERAIRMTELVKVAPGLMNVAPDVILKELGASLELVERVRKSLPPELQDEDKNKQPIPPQAQAQMKAMATQLEQLTAALNEAQDALKGKTLDIESRERIETRRIELQRELELYRLQLEDRKLQLDAMKHQTKLDSDEARDVFKAETSMVQQNQQMQMQQAAQSAGEAAQQM